LPQRESVFSIEHDPQSEVHSPLITVSKSRSHSKLSPDTEIVGEGVVGFAVGDGQLLPPPPRPPFASTSWPSVQIAIATNTARNREGFPPIILAEGRCH